MDLYRKISYDASKLITKSYSTSFSLGIMAFEKKYREPIYAIYGFVRIADEIVDSFHDHDKAYLLSELRNDTLHAIKEGISTNPILNSFQDTVNRYKIDMELIKAFLDSMEMDLSKSTYDKPSYSKYIYGSAEVVGLMCLKVFLEGDEEKYNKLLMPAKALGSAFQKVNFLRDIQGDYEERGRIYLPDASDHKDITDANKEMLEKEIEAEFDQSLKGIKRLPNGVKLGVYSAYLYYSKLFNKIRKRKIAQILDRRTRIPNPYKLYLLLYSYIKVRVLRLI